MRRMFCRTFGMPECGYPNHLVSSVFTLSVQFRKEKQIVSPKINLMDLHLTCIFPIKPFTHLTVTILSAMVVSSKVTDLASISLTILCVADC